ncbi:MAG: hypothetical protein KDI64_21220 [Candidatus Accumulibacter sp.]|nr:hypothetical protein [Accumulibacter sp.]
MRHGGMAIASLSFTAGRVSKFPCEEGKAMAFLRDTDWKGPGLKASRGGSTHYVLARRLKSGATIRLTIGSPNAWTSSAASEEARRLQTLIDQGVGPRSEKSERLAAAEAKRHDARRRTSPAMEAWQAYLAAHTP